MLYNRKQILKEEIILPLAGYMKERRSKDGTGSGDLKTEETKGQWLE